MNVFVMMECKKKICRFRSLCQVLHSAKDHFAERNGHSTRQSWQNGRPENRFSSFVEWCDHDTRQRNFFKKKFKLCRVPAIGHSAKKFFLKKSKLCRVPFIEHSAKKFFKKNKNFCRVPSGLTLGKEIKKIKIKIFAECPMADTRQ